MQKRMTNIRVFDKDLVFMGEVSNFGSLMFTRRFQNTGEFELHLNRPNLMLFQNGYYIMIDNDPYMTGVIEYEFDNGDAYIIDQSKDFVVKGYSLAGLFMRRITDPADTTDGYLRWTNTPAEDVMVELVKSQTTLAVDENRRPAYFEVANSQHRGKEITFETRFKNLLDELNTIAVESGLGFAVKLDAQNRKMIFEVLQGVNRIYDANNANSFIFSKSFGRVTAQSYEHSTMGTSNYAYVLGQGDGTSRTQVETGETETTGWERRELYVDARDIADESEEEGYDAEATLTARGEEKLSEVKEVTNYDFLANPSEYKDKWNLGDACTYRGEEQGVLMAAQITEVAETWEGAVHTVEPVFGNRTTTIKGTVSNAQTGAGLERIGVDKAFASVEEKQTEMTEDIYRAQQSADGKNTIFYNQSMPSSGIAPGDVWFAPNQGYKMYRWTGSTWLAEQFGNEAIADASITNAKIANATISDAKISTVDVGKLTAGGASINKLSAISANLGTINAGTINGVVVNSTEFNIDTTDAGEDIGINFSSNGSIYGSIYADIADNTNSMYIDCDRVEVVSSKFNFTTIPYLNGAPLPIFVGKSEVIKGWGIDSCTIKTTSELTSIFRERTGLNITVSNENVVMLAMNGHADANAAHVQGVTYVAADQSWRALFDRNVSDNIRINWVAFYVDTGLF